MAKSTSIKAAIAKFEKEASIVASDAAKVTHFYTHLQQPSA
jgi:hypothetical protein